MEQLANFVLMLVLWVLVVVGMFDAVRKLTAFGISRRLAYQVTGYALVSALVGSFYFWVHQREVELIEGLDRNPYVQLPHDWAKDQAAEAREKGSKSYATAAFMGHGLLLKHFDSRGQWVQFQPTAKDIAEREYAVSVRTQLAEQSQSFWRLTLEWWFGCLIAALVGFFAGRRERGLAANSTVETDARESARGSP